MDAWAFAVSPHGLGLTGAQFWNLTPREFYALRDVWEDVKERDIVLSASLQAAVYNAIGGGKKGGGQFHATDFYRPRRKSGNSREGRISGLPPADPLDPHGGQQTVEEKRWMIRSILSEAAENMPKELPAAVSAAEMPEWQRAAVERAWRTYADLTNPPEKLN